MKGYIYRLKPKRPLQPSRCCTRPLPKPGTVCYSTYLLRLLPLCQWDPSTPRPLHLPLSSCAFLLLALGDSHLPPQKALLCSSHTGELCPTSTPTGQESGQPSTIYQKAAEELRSLSSCGGKRGTRDLCHFDSQFEIMDKLFLKKLACLFV